MVMTKVVLNGKGEDEKHTMTMTMTIMTEIRIPRR